MIELGFGVEYHLHGLVTRKIENKNENALVICNHFSRLDWLYLWSFFRRTNHLKNLVIVLKNDLGQLPVFGWAMKIWKFILLKRDWKTDQVEISSKLLKFGNKTLLIFPEGTDLSASNVEKSNKYAVENHLPEYKHVLHPKTRGFSHVLEWKSDFDAIYDLTIKYEGLEKNKRPNEMTVIRGQHPKKVHVWMERFELNETILSRKDEWLQERWKVKEEFLASEESKYQDQDQDQDRDQDQDQDQKQGPNFKEITLLGFMWSIMLIIFGYLSINFFSGFALFQLFMIVVCASSL